MFATWGQYIGFLNNSFSNLKSNLLNVILPEWKLHIWLEQQSQDNLNSFLEMDNFHGSHPPNIGRCSLSHGLK